MSKFRYKMAQFMMGRNGFDSLCRFILALSMICVVADLFVRSGILDYIALALIIYAYFRGFSRNISRRYAENYWYISHIKSPFLAFIHRDRKHYKYFKCPCCHQSLRAPRGRGHLRITCSKCHNVFEKKV
jgi:hypothetical protein